MEGEDARPPASLHQHCTHTTASTTMSVEVRKSSPVVVRPPLPVPATARGTIKLSPLDKELHRVPNTVLLLFEDPIHDAAETIQGALSRALVHYYPFSGRIVAGADDVHIECSDEGVEFVAASASSTMEEVLSFDRSPGARKLLDELAVYYPAMACGPGDPLLLVQVTEFSCGGFVLGVTWNHGVADGAGMGQFLQAVGEIAAGEVPSIAPVRWDDSLHSLPPSVLQVQEHIMSLEALDNPGLIVTHDITFSMDSIDRIRAEFSTSFHGQPCTTFEAVLAVLWQCRTRAIRLVTETPILLVFVADIRKHVGVKKGYYGNCGVEQLVMAKSGGVADGELKDVIMAIKHAKDQIPVRLKENEGMVGIQIQQELCKLRTYDTLTVTSWRNLGFDQVDFGSGRTARVTSSGKDFPPFPSAAGFLSNGRGGVSLHSAAVWEEHADAFLAELAKYSM